MIVGSVTAIRGERGRCLVASIPGEPTIKDAPGEAEAERIRGLKERILTAFRATRCG